MGGGGCLGAGLAANQKEDESSIRLLRPAIGRVGGVMSALRCAPAGLGGGAFPWQQISGTIMGSVCCAVRRRDGLIQQHVYLEGFGRLLWIAQRVNRFKGDPA